MHCHVSRLVCIYTLHVSSVWLYVVNMYFVKLVSYSGTEL